ncbi:hypothetical protein VTO73DRAFT_10554 [Trametes versicolor]
MGDLLRVLAWLYERHPNGQRNVLAKTARMLEEKMGNSLLHFFREENFPSIDSDTRQHSFGTPDPGIRWRSMNTIKALTTVGARYRLSGSLFDRKAIDEAWSTLVQHQGHPSGTYTPDTGHSLFGDFERIHSLTESMRSVSYLYQVTGDPQYADRAERIFYNAFWAASDRHTWTTLWSASLCKGSYPESGPYYGVFKSDPSNCDASCSVHTYPEGWPDFIYDAFLTTADRTSLVHVHPGPFTVNTTLAEGNQVAVNVDTIYPFNEDTLLTTIIAEKPFTYYVRIPEWAHNATISVNGGDVSLCDPVNSLHAVPVGAGATNITLTFPTSITTDSLPAGRTMVRRGPLLFAYDRFAHLNPDPTAHYAIDPSTLRASDVRAQWVFSTPAMRRTLAVAACPVGGKSWWDKPDAYESNRAVCVGAVRNLTLTAYAGSSFHDQADLEFPTFLLSNVSGYAGY